jgi:WD40 repeat protein
MMPLVLVLLVQIELLVLGRCWCYQTSAAAARCATGVQFGVVFDVALSDDGALAVSVSDDFTARVWDLEDFSCQHVLEGHSGW